MSLKQSGAVLIFLFALMAIILAGCGGDSSAGEEAPPAVTQESGSPSTVGPPTQAAQQDQQQSAPLLTPSLAPPRQGAPPTPSLAASPTRRPLAQVTFNSINVRNGPGMRNASIGFLYKGDTVEILGRNDDSTWYRIDYKNRPDAWIAASVVELID